jgi:hypothetical protein
MTMSKFSKSSATVHKNPSPRMDAQRSGSSAYLLMSFHDIENLMPLEGTADNTKLFRTFLMGQPLSSFEYHLRRLLEAHLLFQRLRT